MRAALLLLVVATVGFGACSDRSLGGGTGTGGGTGSNTGGSSAGTGGASGASTTGASSSGSGSTGGGVCDGFANESSEQSYTLELRNLRDVPIFVPPLAPCSTAVFDLVAEGGPDAGRWPFRDCDPTCEENMMDLCVCPDGPCATPSFLRVEPGGVYSETWPGLVDIQHDLPQECVPGSGLCPPGSCPVHQRAPAGTYNLAVALVELPVECAAMGGDPGLCECVPNADGWCQTQASLQEDPLLGLAATFSHPGTDPIVVEVQ